MLFVSKQKRDISLLFDSLRLTLIEVVLMTLAFKWLSFHAAVLIAIAIMAIWTRAAISRAAVQDAAGEISLENWHHHLTLRLALSAERLPRFDDEWNEHVTVAKKDIKETLEDKRIEAQLGGGWSPYLITFIASCALTAVLPVGCYFLARALPL